MDIYSYEISKAEDLMAREADPLTKVKMLEVVHAMRARQRVEARSERQARSAEQHTVLMGRNADGLALIQRHDSNVRAMFSPPQYGSFRLGDFAPAKLEVE